VVIEVNDKAEVLYMEKTAPAGPGTEPPGNSAIARNTHLEVGLKELEDAAAGSSRQIPQIAVRPHFSDGRESGMVITGIRAGSVFSRLGLKNGDILHKVNGMPFKSRYQIQSLYKGLVPGSRISMEIKRKGRQRQMSYQVR